MELIENCKRAIAENRCLGCVGLAEKDWIPPKKCPYLPSAEESIKQIKLNLRNGEKMTEEEFLIEMKNFFENIDKLKIDLEEQIKRVEFERNDLLHDLELGNLNAVELTKVAVVLRDVLKERRTYKDELVKVMTLKGFTDKYNNKLITGDIIQVLKNLKTLEKNNQERTYNPRVIKKLKCTEAKDENISNRPTEI